MTNNNSEVKQVGKFIMQYRDEYHVAISWKGYHSIASQLITSEKVTFLTPTHRHLNLRFEEGVYPGIIFRIPPSMSHQQVEERLRYASRS